MKFDKQNAKLSSLEGRSLIKYPVMESQVGLENRYLLWQERSLIREETKYIICIFFCLNLKFSKPLSIRAISSTVLSLFSISGYLSDSNWKRKCSSRGLEFLNLFSLCQPLQRIGYLTLLRSQDGVGNSPRSAPLVSGLLELQN